MSSTKKRRGSVLVMVAFMLVVFMAMGAIAADIGRFYVVTGELQTAADAAALKGASVLQLDTSMSSVNTDVDTAVENFVLNTNRSDGKTLVAAPDSIRLGYWTPGSPGTFTTNYGTLRPNAVYVSLANKPQGTFSQLIGRSTGYDLSRHAIAWIANISVSCVRPWALQYLPLVQKVNGNTDTTQGLDPTKFVSYQSTSVANRTMIYRFELQPNTPTSDGSWSAYNMPSQSGGGATSGATMYQNQIANCNGIAMNSDAGNGNYQPNNGAGPCGFGTLVCWATSMIDGSTSGSVQGPGFCQPFAAGDATCYDQSTGNAGVVMDIAFANVASQGAQGIDFKYVGEATLACYFDGSPNQVCSAIQDPRPKTGYPAGTLVIVTNGLKSRTLNPTDIASNAPSNVQRFLLVE